MGDRFHGWSEAAQRFFIGLQLDNSKAYFEVNRQTYMDEVRGPMEALLAAVQDEFGTGKVFRINRDIRFSADKSPYKTNIAATCEGGYVSLSASGLFAGAGWYHPERDWLARYREAVAGDQGTELEAIVGRLEDGGYDFGGEEMKVVPRPYPRDHPRGRLLRHRHLIVSRSFGLQPWLGTPEALDRVVEVWRAARPLTNWVETNVGKGAAEPVPD
jgi:uncharacterized protein (TIGR02453 family)